MYSLVLAAALATGEGAADFHWRHWGHHHGWHHNYGACYGACYGVGYHGWGGWGLPYGGYGWAGPAHGHGPYPGPWVGDACCGGGGHVGPAYGVPMSPLVVPPVAMPPAESDRKDKDKDEDEDKKMDKDKGMDMDKDKGKKKKDDDADEEDKTQARVIFVLPEGARLHVDGQMVEQSSGVRTFSTPGLQHGKRYFYDVRVEVVRDGKPVSENRRIVLRAGAVIRADFSNVGPATGVAAADRR
jgi:uncharacterized protein (TIGR03000 family)